MSISASDLEVTFGDVTSNQTIGIRFMGTAFDFMPLLLSNRSVQAEGHGQHRYSKTLKCASRPQGLTKGP